jgi:hypothetical protein
MILTKIALATSIALPGLALISGPAPALQSKSNTPKNSLMVVTANLEEAWPGDLSGGSQMNTFAERVLDEFMYRPDVLAVQEVKESSAKQVAQLLTRKSGKQYKVVVMPHANPFFTQGGRAHARETSIIINTDTMKVLNKGGFHEVSAAPADETEPHDPVLENAYALLKRKGTGKKFATMSVHTLPRGYICCGKDEYYRNLWAKQAHNFLKKKWGGKRGLRYLIAGDFNQEVCERNSGFKCFKYYDFAKTLKGFGYQDTSKQRGPVDLIWSKGMGGSLHNRDSGYDGLGRARYADHAFRYTILGPDKYDPLPPKPLKTDLMFRPKGPGGEDGTNARIEIRWGEGDDRGGTGVSRIELEIMVRGTDWRRIPKSEWDGTSGLWTYADYNENPDYKWGDTVLIRVRAVDKAGNKSSWANKTVAVQRDQVGSS